MAKRRSNKKIPKSVEALTHDEARRTYIPTAEYGSVMEPEDLSPVQIAYQRRNRDLDPQLVWRGKDEQDWSDLVAPAPPLFIQEKVNPKVLIDDLMRHTEEKVKGQEVQMDLFADFDGVSEAATAEFYKHDANWTNRMILGDSLHVMASLAEREGLRGKVQCIYLDPPYGIKFNSNFQWSTTSRDVKDGKAEHITREPEQVKAFRDTWRDGIHSYLTYLRDRLTVARDLLSDSGSIFVQIGDENVHRVRALMDEVFGDVNFVSQIVVNKTSGLGARIIENNCDYLLWYARDVERVKSRHLFRDKETVAENDSHYQIDANGDLFTLSDLTGQMTGTQSCLFEFVIFGKAFRHSPGRQWKTTEPGLQRLTRGGRIAISGKSIRYKRYLSDFPVMGITNEWSDLGGSVQSRNDPKVYVVQSSTSIVARCVLLSTDPGDLVLDPTCGSGTTAYSAEQWGRRWITIDTSRVALALARARIMGARYPYYLLSDSPEGNRKEAELSGKFSSEKPTYNSIRAGFVYKRTTRIMLKTFALNTEIDVIWENKQPQVLEALGQLNATLRGHAVPFEVTNGGRVGHKMRFDGPEEVIVTLPSSEEVPVNELLEWEVPRDAPDDWPEAAHDPLADFWGARIARQKAIDASIAAKADFEYLYDKPYVDTSKVRVGGPFTVESLSPHRVLAMDENDELIGVKENAKGYGEERDFVEVILENLKIAGVQQAHKDDKIDFISLIPWPGTLVCAEGRYVEGDLDSGAEKRAAIFIGPEFGTVTRPDLVEAAREAADAGFDALISCAFNYEAHATEFNKLGRVPVLKARMNADLHMADDLKNTGKGNLFVIFGEPDIEILDAEEEKIQVKVNGVDVFHPQTGEVRSDGPEGIACWFIDTDYNEESFFVRHAYFLGTNDPYKALKTTLKAEINEEAWSTLHTDTSRAFPKPASGRIAVKVINHLGDEVMKVFRVA